MKITEYADTVKKRYQVRNAARLNILGSLLFLLYVKDLHNSSNVLVTIMLANDINLFFQHSNINKLFKTVNDELIKINESFSANKLSTVTVLFSKVVSRGFLISILQDRQL